MTRKHLSSTKSSIMVTLDHPACHQNNLKSSPPTSCLYASPMHLQFLKFFIIGTAFGLVTADAEQNDASKPFSCSTVHPIGYCGRVRDTDPKTTAMALAKGPREHYLCDKNLHMKTAWCCFSKKLKFTPSDDPKVHIAQTADVGNDCQTGRVLHKKHN